MRRISFAVLVFTMPLSAMAMESYVKQWDVAAITVSIPESHYKFYFEPQIRWIGDRYIFDQSLLLGGMGYQFNPNFLLTAGAGWVNSKSPQTGATSNETRIWQQANWKVVNNDKFHLDSRTRMEERKNAAYSEYALRFRQRLWVHVPFQRFPKHSFSVFDEVFFNLNHPNWVSPYTFEQNRFFIGIGNVLAKNISMDVGYLNQYLHSNTNQLNHVLFVSFTMNF